MASKLDESRLTHLKLEWIFFASNYMLSFYVYSVYKYAHKKRKFIKDIAIAQVLFILEILASL
jgi:hypothetical protein